MIKSRAIAAKPAKLVIPAHLASGLITAAGVSTSLGAGAAPHSELSAAASEDSGVQMKTADELYFRIDREALNHFDLTKSLELEVKFESGKAGVSTGIIWSATIKGYTAAQAIDDAKVGADGSVTFSAASTLGTSMPTRTEKKSLQTGGKAFDLDEVLILAVTLDADGDAAATDIRLLSVILSGTWSIDSTTGLYEVT